MTQNTTTVKKDKGVHFYKDCADCVSFQARVSSRNTPRTESDYTFKGAEEVPTAKKVKFAPDMRFSPKDEPNEFKIQLYSSKTGRRTTPTSTSVQKL